MKILCIALFLLITVFACQSPKTDSTSINGTYARVFENDIYTLFDTISLLPTNQTSGNVYQISERSRTNFKKPEDQHFNKSAKHSGTGTFDSEKNIMHTEDPDILYSFDPSKGSLQINDILYQKIK